MSVAKTCYANLAARPLWIPEGSEEHQGPCGLELRIWGLRSGLLVGGFRSLMVWVRHSFVGPWRLPGPWTFQRPLFEGHLGASVLGP